MTLRSKRSWVVAGSLILGVALLVLLDIGGPESDEPDSRTSVEPMRKPKPAEPLTSPKPAPAAGHSEAGTAPVADDLCGVSGPDKVRRAGETLEQHLARVTE